MGGLLTLFHALLEVSQYAEVAQGRASDNVLNLSGLLVLLLTAATTTVIVLTARLVLHILERARVGKDDALRVLDKLDDHERQLLAELSLRAILLDEVLRCSETFATLVEGDDGTLVHRLRDLANVDRTRLVDRLVGVPRILLQLFVAKAEATVLLVDLEDDHVDRLAHLCEL